MSGLDGPALETLKRKIRSEQGYRPQSEYFRGFEYAMELVERWIRQLER